MVRELIFDGSGTVGGARSRGELNAFLIAGEPTVAVELGVSFGDSTACFVLNGGAFMVRGVSVIPIAGVGGEIRIPLGHLIAIEVVGGVYVSLPVVVVGYVGAGASLRLY